MNQNLIGGWKYLNEKTGEFFHDLSDIRDSIRRILKNTRDGGVYEPRKWITTHYGDEISGKKLKQWVDDHFLDRVHIPAGTRRLIPYS